jgi:hypothetical protein
MSDDAFGHRPVDEARRRRKARLLADAALELGLTDEDLLPGTGNRRRVMKAAGVKRVTSEDTWFVVHELMTP